MAQILIIVGVAVVVVALLAFAVVMRRPAHGDDSDRFTQARRITTTWAADAGTDLVHPTPGQPGTVDTSPEATESPETAVTAGTPEAAVAPETTEATEATEAPERPEPSEAIDLRRQTAPRPSRRPPRA